MLGERFGDLMSVEPVKSGIEIKKYQFDRYCTVLAGLEKMLKQYNAKLKLSYNQGTPGAMDGAVYLCAVPVI